MVQVTFTLHTPDLLPPRLMFRLQPRGRIHSASRLPTRIIQRHELKLTITQDFLPSGYGEESSKKSKLGRSNKISLSVPYPIFSHYKEIQLGYWYSLFHTEFLHKL